jgi:hypothetical protein
MTAGQTIQVNAEFDWSRKYVRKDFSVTARSSSVPVIIKESTGLASASYILQM